MSRFRLNFEYVFLLLFIAAFLFLALGNRFDHRLTHEYPYGYFASDAFFHNSVADYMKQQGIIKYTPPWEVGGHEGVYDAHPPMLFQLTLVFSNLTGFESYDSIYIITVLSVLGMILLFYIITRKASRSIAMLGLPFSLLILTKTFKISFAWGYWLFAVGAFFMAALWYAIINLELKRSYMIMGLMYAAVALAHPPEIVYGVIFTALYAGLKFFREKKIDPRTIKTIVIAGIIGLVLSAYSLNIFVRSFLLTEGFRGDFVFGQGFGMPFMSLAELLGWTGFAQSHGWIGISIGHTGFLTFFEFLGLLVMVALMTAAIMFLKNSRNMWDASFVSLFSFALGYLIYFGVGKRALTHRFYWYVYALFFIGTALYFLITIAASIAGKKLGSRAVVFIAAVLLLLTFSNASPETKMGSGVMDKDNWDAIRWISKNTPKNELIFYLYGDTVAHNAPVYSAERVGLIAAQKNYQEASRNKRLNETQRWYLADSYQAYVCDLGFPKLGYYSDRLRIGNPKCEDRPFKPLNEYPDYIRFKSVCNMTYLYIPTRTQNPFITQYNNIFRQTLLSNDWITEVYRNNRVSIIQNTKPGVECFGNLTEA